MFDRKNRLQKTGNSIHCCFFDFMLKSKTEKNLGQEHSLQIKIGQFNSILANFVLEHDFKMCQTERKNSNGKPIAHILLTRLWENYNRKPIFLLNKSKSRTIQAFEWVSESILRSRTEKRETLQIRPILDSMRWRKAGFLYADRFISHTINSILWPHQFRLICTCLVDVALMRAQKKYERHNSFEFCSKGTISIEAHCVETCIKILVGICMFVSPKWKQYHDQCWLLFWMKTMKNFKYQR